LVVTYSVNSPLSHFSVYRVLKKAFARQLLSAHAFSFHFRFAPTFVSTDVVVVVVVAATVAVAFALVVGEFCMSKIVFWRFDETNNGLISNCIFAVILLAVQLQLVRYYSSNSNMPIAMPKKS